MPSLQIWVGSAVVIAAVVGANTVTMRLCSVAVKMVEPSCWCSGTRVVALPFGQVWSTPNSGR